MPILAPPCFCDYHMEKPPRTPGQNMVCHHAQIKNQKCPFEKPWFQNLEKKTYTWQKKQLLGFEVWGRSLEYSKTYPFLHKSKGHFPAWGGGVAYVKKDERLNLGSD